MIGADHDPLQIGIFVQTGGLGGLAAYRVYFCDTSTMFGTVGIGRACLPRRSRTWCRRWERDSCAQRDVFELIRSARPASVRPSGVSPGGGVLSLAPGPRAPYSGSWRRGRRDKFTEGELGRTPCARDGRATDGAPQSVSGSLWDWGRQARRAEPLRRTPPQRPDPSGCRDSDRIRGS